MLLLGTLAFSGCTDSKSSSAGGTPGRGNVVPVEGIVLKSQVLANKIAVTGSLLANEEVELRPEVSGRVVGVYFEEGRRIKKGELLLKINDRELQAEYSQRELQEKLASDEERRKRSILEINGISQEEYDKSLNALKIVQADKEVIASQIAETELRAPFDGIVGLRYVSEGGFVSPNMLAATMQDIDPMKVEFSVPEKYAGKLKSGTRVLVKVGESDDNHVGLVYAVESKIDPSTRTIKARARIPNQDSQLVPGSFAKVEITLEEIPNAIVVPTEAVIPDIGGEKVFVAKDGKAVSVRVHTGIRAERTIQIADGLSPNDTLIVTGLLQIADGRAVQVTERVLDSKAAE